ncbi:hypothetical protein [Kitasatospora sp. Root187]|uniref:hypothetical protein n=1 Tax=Kitasatospora sp. Root187 TaxID=1736486 RepID=UPI0012F9D025|nr:hypothetical protein [Kitasatospora sp. Root187]
MRRGGPGVLERAGRAACGDRRAAGEVPAERSAALYSLIRSFPGSLPELLDAVDAEVAVRQRDGDTSPTS